MEQMILCDIFFGGEIWTELSNFARQKTEKLPTLVAKEVKSDPSW